MVAQQFIDYIRRQLSAGIARDDIKKALAINGLSEQEVAEGFALAGGQAAVAPLNPVPAGTTPSVPITAKVVSEQAVKSVWGIDIPYTNRSYMKLSLVLVFGLDLAILFFSGLSPLLLPFWTIMLVVLGIFAAFFYLENYVFSERFKDTESHLDAWISRIIKVRNFVFVLNFVPGVQILGLMPIAGLFALIPFVLIGGSSGLEAGELMSGRGAWLFLAPGVLVLYLILMALRFSSTKRQQQTKPTSQPSP